MTHLIQACDVLFVVDASADVGFGHAARCLHLADLVRQRRPRAGIAFQGSFTDAAQVRIARAKIDIVATDHRVNAPICFVDRLATPDNADICDPAQIRDLQQRCGRVVYMASGVRAPELPDGVICIGYQPGGPPERPPWLLWGWRFAPVPEGFSRLAETPPEHGSVLIALGGGADAATLRRVVDAVRATDQAAKIDILGSPVWRSDLVDAIGADRILWHKDVPDVRPLLAGAALVVASQGNFAYEAMAAARPLVILGLKAFQANIGHRLAEAGLAVYGGTGTAQDSARLASALARGRADAAALRATMRETIDDRGFVRIADQLLEDRRVTV